MTYSEKVIEAIQSGKLDIVDENIELALDLDDDDTLYLLGNTLLQLGFLKETKQVYNHLIDIHPNDDELKIYLAEIEIEDGNEIEALELLHSIDESSESYPQSLLVQADYYHLNNLPEVSIQKLQEASKLLPDEPVIYFALAEVYFTIADHQNAINYYENLLEMGIEEVAGTLVNARLGDSYLMIGEYQKAIDNLKTALTFKDDPTVYYQLGFVYVNQEKYHQAIETLNQAKELDPNLIAVYILLAVAYDHLNQLREALEIAQEGLSINDMNVELYLTAADLATKTKKYDLADEYYTKAVGLDSENEQTILKYAHYLELMGEYEDIVDLYEQSSEKLKQTPDAMWVLAIANNELDEYDKARELFSKAYKYLDKQLNFLKDYAIFLREDGQREKMKEIINRYLAINPELDEEMTSLLEDDMF